MKRLAYLALGANLPSQYGRPEETLQAAVNRLDGEAGRLAALSSLYETEPAGRRDQPVFFNAAAALETELSPQALLGRMLALELAFGRRREAETFKGPRTLDLDLLLMDDLALRQEDLTLPHLALAERRFVLVPLAEIAPDLRHPLLDRSVSELLGALPDVGENRAAAVRRVESASWRGPILMAGEASRFRPDTIEP